DARGSADLNVHAKVMVVDDVLARVGSANMSNRSMGLDTECDVALEARGRPHVARVIAGFRNRLLAEHLGTTPDQIGAAVGRPGSLMRVIARFGERPRTLVPVSVLDCDTASIPMPDIPIADLERPVSHAPFFEWLLPPGFREPVLHALVRGGRALAAAACA